MVSEAQPPLSAGIPFTATRQWENRSDPRDGSASAHQAIRARLSDGDNESSQLVALSSRLLATPRRWCTRGPRPGLSHRGQAHAGKRREFQPLLNCLDGVATTDRVITVATANPPSASIRDYEAAGAFDRVVRFAIRSNLRRQYYLRLNPILTGDEFEIAIEKTDGFSFRTYAKPTSRARNRLSSRHEMSPSPISSKQSTFRLAEPMSSRQLRAPLRGSSHPSFQARQSRFRQKLRLNRAGDTITQIVQRADHQGGLTC